jgi:hypothetical protein
MEPTTHQPGFAKSAFGSQTRKVVGGLPIDSAINVTRLALIVRVAPRSKQRALFFTYFWLAWRTRDDDVYIVVMEARGVNGARLPRLLM